MSQIFACKSENYKDIISMLYAKDIEKLLCEFTKV